MIGEYPRELPECSVKVNVVRNTANAKNRINAARKEREFVQIGHDRRPAASIQRAEDHVDRDYLVRWGKVDEAAGAGVQHAPRSRDRLENRPYEARQLSGGVGVPRVFGNRMLMNLLVCRSDAALPLRCR